MHATLITAMLLTVLAGALAIGSHLNVETLVVAFLGLMALALARHHLRR